MTRDSVCFVLSQLESESAGVLEGQVLLSSDGLRTLTHFHFIV